MAAKTGTYTLIASSTVTGSATSSVTFSSIPQTYTDLRIVMAPIGTTDIQLTMRYNGDTATNYSDTILAGNGTTASSARDTSANIISLDYYFSGTTNGGLLTCDIMDYANTTTYKTSLIRSGEASKATMAIVSLWRSTAAISSFVIAVRSGGSSLAVGSTFKLYGIEAAK